MKFLVIALVLVGCAHNKPTTVQPPSRKELMTAHIITQTNTDLERKAIAYGALVAGSRFLRLVDVQMDKEGDVGVAVVEVSGEQHEPVGKIFLYFLCTTKCSQVFVISKTYNRPKNAAWRI